MPEPREHMKERNWLESILHKVPGFRGYLDKENRRESDALQRQWLADRLERCKRALDDYTRTLADGGQLAQLPRYDRFRGRIDQLIGRIRGGMQGYSGVFDLVRVDEAQLDRVYEYDVILIERVENVAGTVEKLPRSPGESDASALVGSLSGEIDELERAWDRREDMLKGLE
ncbi:MAG TPA: hypothetical protein VJ809_14345 [Pirellulales bacterium]|nr:hypothetical protein [Pirellulales bacterium]